MEGYVYVPVMAGETTMTTFAAGSNGGNVATGYTIYWTSGGGITNNGWEFPDGEMIRFEIGDTEDDVNNKIIELSQEYGIKKMQRFFKAECFVVS